MPSLSPPTITFPGTNGIILRIHPDGRFELGPGATADDAAQAIVKAATALMQRALSERTA